MIRSRVVVGLVALQLAALAYACGSDEAPSGSATNEDGGGGRAEADGSLDGGHGDALDSATESDASLPPNAVVQLALGRLHSCALLGSGDVWCWGRNDLGLMGIGTFDSTIHAPTKVPGLSSIVSIAAGTAHMCAVDKLGTVQCWGFNSHMQLGHDNADGSDSFCQGSPCTLAPRPVAGLGAAKSVVASSNVSCARLVSGELKCWGYNGYGLLGHSPPDLPCNADEGGCNFNPSTVSGGAGDDVVLSLPSGCVLNGGAVSCWGAIRSDQLGAPRDFTPVPVAGLPAIKQLGAGHNTVYAIGPGGSLYGWGSNTNGGVGNGCSAFVATPELVIDAGVVAVHGGLQFGCGVLSTGTVSCWGQNYMGGLGPDVDAGAECQLPTAVAGLSDVVQLASGYWYSCAVKSDNSVWCWGDNSKGQAGHDPTNDPSCKAPKCSPTPTKVVGLP